jgi:hypothetical protein
MFAGIRDATAFVIAGLGKKSSPLGRRLGSTSVRVLCKAVFGLLETRVLRFGAVPLIQANVD